MRSHSKVLGRHEVGGWGTLHRRLPRWLRVKNLPVNAGDVGSIPVWEDPLEKEMATHSSILAWEIPWAEDPGGL